MIYIKDNLQIANLYCLGMRNTISKKNQKTQKTYLKENKLFKHSIQLKHMRYTLSSLY